MTSLTITISNAANAVMHDGKFLYDAREGKQHVYVTSDVPLNNGDSFQKSKLKEITDIFARAGCNIGHKTYYYTNDTTADIMAVTRELAHT